MTIPATPTTAKNYNNSTTGRLARAKLMPSEQLFTTGMVAAVCGVARRTVTQWFDSGKLRGHRIPGGNDRRIPREQLIRFLKENRMPLGGLEANIGKPVLYIGTDASLADGLADALDFDAYDFRRAVDGFAAGAMTREFRPAVAVVDCILGTGVALSIARHLRALIPEAKLCAISNEEMWPIDLEFDNAFVRPSSPAAVAAWIAGAVEGER